MGGAPTPLQQQVASVLEHMRLTKPEQYASVVRNIQAQAQEHRKQLVALHFLAATQRFHAASLALRENYELQLRAIAQTSMQLEAQFAEPAPAPAPAAPVLPQKPSGPSRPPSDEHAEVARVVRAAAGSSAAARAERYAASGRKRPA